MRRAHAIVAPAARLLLGGVVFAAALATASAEDPAPGRAAPRVAGEEGSAPPRAPGAGLRAREAAARAALAAMDQATPRAAAPWRALGEALAALGEHAEAIEAFDRARAARGASWMPVEVAAAQLVAVRRGPGEARRRFEEAVAAADGAPEAGAADAVERLIGLGDALTWLARDDPARFTAALGVYERSAAMAPTDPRPRVRLGELLLGRYNNAEALEAFREALTIDEEDPGALLGLARSMHFDGAPAALAVAQRVIELEPDRIDARVLAARLHLEEEEYEDAARELERALAVNPSSPPALALRASLHYLRDEREAFDALLDRIRAIAPAYVELFVTLAEIAADGRRYADAVLFARTATKVDPSAWRGHALLGTNLMRIGEIDAGRRSLETAFRGDPFDLWTKNTLALLDRMDGFETITSQRFELVAAPGEARVLASIFLPIAEQAFEALAQRYGYRPPTPIRLEVFPRHEDFSVRTVGLTGVDIVGVCFGRVIALDSPSAGRFGPFNWASALWHEVAHSFHLGLTGGRLPRWLAEGLAVHEERRARIGWGADATPGFLSAFAAGRLPAASDIGVAFRRPTYPEQIPHAYFQGSLLVAMIEAAHGFAGIERVLAGHRNGGDTPAILREALGLDAPALDAAFGRYMRLRYASALAALVQPTETPDAAGEPRESDPQAAPQGPYVRAFGAGREALEAGDLDAAVTHLAQARALLPEHAGPGSPYRLLALAHERRGERSAAIEALAANIDIDADDREAHLELARLLREEENSAEAQALERSLHIGPFDAPVHERLAEIREAGHAWAEAAAARAAVVELDPRDPVGARYRLAAALHRAGEPAAARRALLRALESAPLYDDALELLLELRGEGGAARGPGTEG